MDTTFDVSPEVEPGQLQETVDYIGKLRVAFRRPIEATWLPTTPLVHCDNTHALVCAVQIAFYEHLPLRLSPDDIWITLARGFALHVNEHAEALRHRFVSHAGKKELSVTRLDFLPGADNPWPEVFESFNEQLVEHTGGLATLLSADFSTTGPTQRAVSHLMAMETFKSYFEYVLYLGCGIPRITLTGTLADWQQLRARVQRFADFGLEDWIEALDPILAQFERAKAGAPDVEFWKSMFRYRSGSGSASLTGWINVLFPYFKEYGSEQLYKNPFLQDWRERLAIEDAQDAWRGGEPQGVSIGAIPSCFTSVPLKVYWGSLETPMRIVGGLLGVTQDEQSLEISSECGWMLLYEEPVDPLSPFHARVEAYAQRLKEK